MEKVARKLPKAQRREQLLETAQVIVRDEGTDALTLGYLAERAGVSKPIAYGHFQTRSGLMIALYTQINERQVMLLKEALARTPARLEDVARVMSAAYMDCYTAVGPEWHAISAALQGDEQMDAYQQDLIDSYVDFYCEALAPFWPRPKKDLRRRCVGIIGASEAVSHEMVRGRISKAQAAADMTSLIVSWIAKA
jgi:AcrR family transcriptional regulator